MNYREVLLKAEKNLSEVSVINPRLDCEVLLSNVLKQEREKILINLKKKN